MIIDLSVLNKYMKIDYFHMETASTIRRAIRSGSWAIFISLQDVYFHIPIYRASREVLGILFDGTVSVPGPSVGSVCIHKLDGIAASLLWSLGP